MRALLAGAATVVLALAAPVASADVALTGAVRTPLTLTPSALATEPQVSLHVAFSTGHGDEAADYSGVPLWAMLEKAGLVDGQAKDAHLRHGILVTGADGYGVLLAVGEIDPEFAGKQVLLAIKRDGQPLAGDEGIRLVVPGDKRGGRSVRHVVKIEVE